MTPTPQPVADERAVAKAIERSDPKWGGLHTTETLWRDLNTMIGAYRAALGRVAELERLGDVNRAMISGATEAATINLKRAEAAEQRERGLREALQAIIAIENRAQPVAAGGYERVDFYRLAEAFHVTIEQVHLAIQFTGELYRRRALTTEPTT